MSQYGSSAFPTQADTRSRASAGSAPRYVAMTVTVTPPAAEAAAAHPSPTPHTSAPSPPRVSRASSTQVDSMSRSIRPLPFRSSSGRRVRAPESAGVRGALEQVGLDDGQGRVARDEQRLDLVRAELGGDGAVEERQVDRRGGRRTG